MGIKKIAQYGIGNFGYALLKHLDQKRLEGVALHAYDRNEELRSHLGRERRHLYFHRPTKLSGKITFENNVEELLKDSDVLILAIASNATEEVVSQIARYVNPSSPVVIVNTAKALDHKSGERLSEVVARIMGPKLQSYALLAGGTIARDLFKHEPLGASLACENSEVLESLAKLFQSDNLYIDPSTDLAGTEYAAAFKNIVSIIAGITNGLGFSYGAETHLIARTAGEVETLVTQNLKGEKETFKMSSQCWGNDLWMSCTGRTRNREFGVLIGKGLKPEQALVEMTRQKKTVEGMNTVRTLSKIRELQSYPILHSLSQLFSQGISLQEFRNSIFYNRGYV